MTDTLPRLGSVQLSIGDPPIYRTPYGRGTLVDFGDVVPVPFATFDAAVAEVAARTRSRLRCATVPVAGIPVPGDRQAPGPSSSPQEMGPGAPKALLRRKGEAEGPTPTAVGPSAGTGPSA